MLRALLLFVAISTVFSLCQPNFEHDEDILDYLYETFYFQRTTSARVIDCEKMTWTGDDYNLEAIVQSPGCCRRIHNPIYTPDYVNFTVTPINPLPGCLQTAETVTFQTIDKTGTGDNLCLTCSVTRQERQGIFVVCRKQVVEQTFLDELCTFIQNLANDVTDWLCTILGQPPEPLVFNKIRQENCGTFPPNNCGS